MIIETKKRGVLNEGTNNGMAFAFLEKKEEDYLSVQPFSPCKDYLDEVVTTEKTGIPTKGCGLIYPKKLNIFSDVAYLGIKILKTKDNQYYYSDSFENDVETLKKNHKNIEKLVNQIEDIIGLKKSVIEEQNDDYFLITLDSKWCDSTISISLYSLLIRVSMIYDGEMDYMKFLENYNYNNHDKHLIENMLKKEKLKLILENKKLPPNRRAFSKNALSKGMQSPHGNGIFSWDCSFEEVKLID